MLKEDNCSPKFERTKDDPEAIIDDTNIIKKEKNPFVTDSTT